MLALGIAIRESCMTVVTGVLISNWLLCVVLAAAGDGSGVEWFGMGVIDFTSAMLVLILAQRSWQMVVAAIYVVMIACHVMRWWTPNTFTPHDYLLALSVLSWAQLAAVMGRAIHVVVRSAQGHDPADRRVSAVGLHRHEDRDAS